MKKSVKSVIFLSSIVIGSMLPFEAMAAVKAVNILSSKTLVSWSRLLKKIADGQVSHTVRESNHGSNGIELLRHKELGKGHAVANQIQMWAVGKSRSRKGYTIKPKEVVLRWRTQIPHLGNLIEGKRRASIYFSGEAVMTPKGKILDSAIYDPWAKKGVSKNLKKALDFWMDFPGGFYVRDINQRTLAKNPALTSILKARVNSAIMRLAESF